MYSHLTIYKLAFIMVHTNEMKEYLKKKKKKYVNGIYYRGKYAIRSIISMKQIK